MSYYNYIIFIQEIDRKDCYVLINSQMHAMIRSGPGLNPKQKIDAGFPSRGQVSTELNPCYCQ